MKKVFFALAAVCFLTACGTAGPNTDSPPEAVVAAAFREAGPKKLTVLTMVNNRSGSGGHTALLVKGSQTVIFDPAGSFRDPRVTERDDVLYGMSPKWVRAYKSSHARSTYHVVSQEITVTPSQAEQALQLVRSNGAVPGAYCANSTSHLLSQIDGFGDVKRTFYPANLMRQIATRSDVRTTKLFEDDDGNVIDAVRAAELIGSE